MKVLLIEYDQHVRNSYKWDLERAGFQVEAIEELPRFIVDVRFLILMARALAHEFDMVLWERWWNFPISHRDWNNPFDITGHIKAFAEVFHGPMVALARWPENFNDQLRAGCTHRYPHNCRLGEFVREAAATN